MDKNLRVVIAVIAMFLGFLIFFALDGPVQPGSGTNAVPEKTH